jgi:hypothetical protein
MLDPRAPAPAWTRTRVGDVRAWLGLTQLDAATCLGLTPVTWSRWENGKSTPVGYGSIVLTLIEESQQKGVSSKEVIDSLRGCDTQVRIIKVLCCLTERIDVDSSPEP